MARKIDDKKHFWELEKEKKEMACAAGRHVWYKGFCGHCYIDQLCFEASEKLENPEEKKIEGIRPCLTYVSGSDIQVVTPDPNKSKLNREPEPKKYTSDCSDPNSGFSKQQEICYQPQLTRGRGRGLGRGRGTWKEQQENSPLTSVLLSNANIGSPTGLQNIPCRSILNNSDFTKPKLSVKASTMEEDPLPQIDPDSDWSPSGITQPGASLFSSPSHAVTATPIPVASTSADNNLPNAAKNISQGFCPPNPFLNSEPYWGDYPTSPVETYAPHDPYLKDTFAVSEFTCPVGHQVDLTDRKCWFCKRDNPHYQPKPINNGPKAEPDRGAGFAPGPGIGRGHGRGWGLANIPKPGPGSVSESGEESAPGPEIGRGRGRGRILENRESSIN